MNIHQQLRGDVVPLDFTAYRQAVLDNKFAEDWDKFEETAKPLSEDDLLIKLNAAYMNQSQIPQPDMLRVTQEAAKEMLARGDAEVFRLVPGGPERLSPLDAIRSNGLWYTDHREFAIRREDIAGMDKWAGRGASHALWQIQRDQQKRHEPEL